MDEIMDQVDPIMLERYAATARIYDGESDVMRIVALDGEPLAECRTEGWLPLGSPVSDDGITPDDGRARDYGLLGSYLRSRYVMRLRGMRERAVRFSDGLARLLPDPPDTLTPTLHAIDGEIDRMLFTDVLEAFDMGEAEGVDFAREAGRIVEDHREAADLLAAFALDPDLAVGHAADALGDPAETARLYADAVARRAGAWDARRARLLAGMMADLTALDVMPASAATVFRRAVERIRGIVG